MDSITYERIPLHLRIQAGHRMAHRGESGEKVVDIANDLKISRSHLYLLEAKFDEDPTMIDKHREGRPSKVDAHLERRIGRALKIDPYQTSSEIANDVNEEMEEEKKISSDTVQRTAHKLGYSACRPLLKPPLDEDQKAARLEFALFYQDRTMHFWRNTIFLDETFIRLHHKDSRKRVWRQKGERLAEEHTLPLVKYGGGGVMFWGCIAWSGPGPLVPVSDTIEGDDYAQILMDNIPQVKRVLNIQTASIIEDWSSVHNTPNVLRTKDVLGLRNLGLPTYSPDLNIIENVWSIIKTRVAERSPGSLEEIVEVALEEWSYITIEDIRAYFYSIPHRLASVIESRGGNTKY